jgi:hypothetical protein
MKNKKMCDYRPLLLSNRLPETYLNNLKPDTLKFGVRNIYRNVMGTTQ